jgi:fatty acid desaturase
MAPRFERAPWMKAVVQAGTAFHVRHSVPWKHNLLNLGSAGALLASTLALIGWGAVAPTWLYLPAAGVLFGVIFFAVHILIIHEASHDMFFYVKDKARNRWWNRLAGHLAGWPFFTDYIRHWEEGHLEHHLRPCEPNDPQDGDPLDGSRLWAMYAKIAFIPLVFVAYNPSRRYPGAAKRALLGALLWVPLIALTTLYLSWQVPVALMLGLHVTMALNWTKKAQEHGCGLAGEPDALLRSRTYFYPFAFLFSPFFIHYHFEHHANFNVPWYRLPAYHRALREIVPSELQPYYFHREFFAQLAGRKALPPRGLLGIEEGAAQA